MWLLQMLQSWLVGDGLGGSATGSAVASFAFLLVPTALMGMTLPLLTMAFDERKANIGVSTGTLYFVNTLGAATGAALVPFVLLPRYPLPQVVWIAVGGNVAVVVCTLLAAQLLLRTPKVTTNRAPA